MKTDESVNEGSKIVDEECVGIWDTLGESSRGFLVNYAAKKIDETPVTPTGWGPEFEEEDRIAAEKIAAEKEGKKTKAPDEEEGNNKK